MRKGIVFIFSLFILFSAKAQTPQTMNSAEILLSLKKLKVIGSVLYVAAHPDDENTRLLAYLSKERLYRTGYLSMTRGDGGQNLIGNEQGIELGMIRTQELLAARRMDGADQFFTRAYDFGFSKTTDEALRMWDKEKILSDVVWVIRKFQPDVIITRFPPDNRAGHGHHSASAVLAREAFDAAADPNRFPEQFKYGVKPWRAKRIVWNTFNFGNTNTTSNEQLKIDVGVYNPLLGKGYGEIASESRSQHKSQGFGVPRQRGPQTEFFTLTGGEAMQNDFADGIVTDWSRYDGGEAINEKINAIVAAYSFQNPAASVKSLIDLYKALNKINNGDWKIKKLEEVKNLIEACAGLFLEATSTEQYAVQGDSLHVNIIVSNRSEVKAEPVLISLSNMQAINLRSNAALVKNALLRERINLVVPSTQPVSQPYWLANTNPKGSFTVDDQLLIGKAESDPAYTVKFTLSIEGEQFVFEKPVMYKFTDPVKGEIYWPLAIVPKVSLEPEPKVFVSNGLTTKTGNIHLRSFTSFNTTGITVQGQGSNGIVKTEIKNGESGPIMIANTDKIIPVIVNKENLSKDINFWVDENAKKWNDSYHEINYDHIPRITYFDKPVIKSFTADVKIASKKIGYINGAGDKVAEGLMQMGYSVSFLDEKDITAVNLKQYDAIVTGIRAYNVHRWLSNAYDALMQFVKEGGVLLVQYNTSNQIGPLKAKMSPYPFDISRNRVTEEDATMNFLAPNHVVMNYPNKITEKDFEGWVQERSVYEADKIDAKFTALFGMNDAGEPQRNGSLIVAEYGKGRFVYSALAFFRQLPAGVPGSYRLIANLLAKPKM
ncbi:MAG: PIG-L family deacetylase [Lacibacter sp.]|nr:PIG-L family deacetylase [Lacibacter sp.]